MANESATYRYGQNVLEQLRQYVQNPSRARDKTPELYHLLRAVPEENHKEFFGLALKVRNILLKQSRHPPDAYNAHPNEAMGFAVAISERAGKAAAAKRKADNLTHMYKLQPPKRRPKKNKELEWRTISQRCQASLPIFCSENNMPKEAAMHDYLQKKSPKVLRDYVEKFGTAMPADFDSLNRLFFYLSYVEKGRRQEFRTLAAAVAIKYLNALNPKFYESLPEKLERLSPVCIIALPYDIVLRARIRLNVARLEDLYGLVRVDTKDLEKELGISSQGK